METSLETAALETLVSVDASLDTTALDTTRFGGNQLGNHRFGNHAFTVLTPLVNHRIVNQFIDL